MFDEEAVRKPRSHEVGMGIDAMSVAELEERIAMLENEIARLKAAIGEREKSRAAADSVFRGN